MKKQTKFTILLLLFVSSISLAQKHKNHHEKIRVYKIAYLTEKLDLSESEAQKFWPLYNTYNENMLTLHKEERHLIKKKIAALGGVSQLEEEEAKLILDKYSTIAKSKVVLKEKFFSEVCSFLPYKKVLSLEIAEHDFNKKLLRKLRKKEKSKS
ncbi:hypothetical protein [Tenacibaculum sp. SG-28]|uniref:hypothetical protein n=1 Tax=Tenacibaculum sp. SG-28 TaxID=754426 RepID=UPI000CF54728|nr:hypothetical protein [Tenacibaculum sp. SG-28]PQJ23070.1 hypothetical protein BSU00_02080 [Tenacibaculum sp. SG-28]